MVLILHKKYLSSFFDLLENFFASSDSHKVDALVDSIAYKQLKYYGFSRIFEKQVFWTSEKDFSE